MKELCLTLEFACCACAGTVEVDVKCVGPGLRGRDPKAAVCVPCPMCETVHDLIFDPNGVVHQVTPQNGSDWPPTPSRN